MEIRRVCLPMYLCIYMFSAKTLGYVAAQLNFLFLEYILCFPFFFGQIYSIYFIEVLITSFSGR